MIGVDAPESVHWDESKNTPEGEIASRWLRERLEEDPANPVLIRTVWRKGFLFGEEI